MIMSFFRCGNTNNQNSPFYFARLNKCVYTISLVSIFQWKSASSICLQLKRGGFHPAVNNDWHGG